VHRALHAYLQGDRQLERTREVLAGVGDHINERARASSKAEADHRHIHEARLFATRIGEEYSGSVTRVRPFGVQVQLDEALVEGTVPLESLPGGPYRPDLRQTALLDAAGESHYTVGTRLRVKIHATDVDLGRIELSIAGVPVPPPPPKWQTEPPP
jgi:ribonuclease R